MKKDLSLLSTLLALGACFVSTAPAVIVTNRAPLANFDLRVPGKNPARELRADQQAPAAALRALVPDVQWRVDEILGAPNFISSPSGFLSGPNAQGRAIRPATAQAIPAQDPHRAIKAFLNEHSALLGFNAAALDAAVIKREHVAPQSGLRTVVWEQQVDGIAVYGSILMGHISKNGELVNLTSHFVPDAVRAADVGAKNNRAALQAAPAVSSAQAVANAAKNLGDDLTVAQITAQAQPVGAEKKQKFQGAGWKGQPAARLVWLPMNASTLRLCWEVVLTSRTRGEMFLCLVDVTTGEVLVRRGLTSYISPATYRVYTGDGPSPFSPGHPTPLTAQPPLVPRVLVVTNAMNTNASPNGWINDGDNETSGNNVDAHTDRNDDDLPDLPRPQGSPARVFDFPLDLTQDPTNYSPAAVVQLFYLCNFIHDKLYELGFTEAAGNFQVNNFGRGGFGSDPVLAQAQDGSGFNNANMSTPADGSSPTMQMYIYDGPTPRRDGDLDAETVIHEYVHGLSNRRVGGGVGINSVQTSGMGEGWSDFYMFALLAKPGDSLDGNYVSSGYLMLNSSPGYAENYYFGDRRYPYSTNLLKNPLTFKDIDPAQASPHGGIPLSPISGGVPGDEVHAQGEVWCVTLWEVRVNLVAKHGFAVGNQLALQLVTDGMTLCPVEPNFLQARDAIIQADQVNNAGANYVELWAAFAKRGLGGSATSPDSSTTAGVVEAFDLPGLAITSTSFSEAFTGNGNGAIDFNECVNISVSIRNGNNSPATGISATLSTLTPGVTIPDAVSAYPNLAVSAVASNLVPFRIFTAPSFVCGTPIDLALVITSATQTRTNRFVLQTGGVATNATTFNNNTVLPIPDDTFPGVDSLITVSGMTGPLGKITVSFFLTHTYDSDLYIQLVAPDNTVITLVNDIGGSGNNFGVNCVPASSRTTLDDAAPFAIDFGTVPFTGTFRPVDPLSNFKGKNPNGVWRLRMADLAAGDTGALQCWSLNVFPTVCQDGGGSCSGDLAVTIADAPDPVLIGSNLTYTITVTNLRPVLSTGVTLTNILPPGVNFLSAVSSQGTCTNLSGTLFCDLGAIAIGGKATVTLVVQPTLGGLLTNTVTVAGTAADLTLTNNTARTVTTVTTPFPVIVPDFVTLDVESFAPATGGIESGETVTLKFALRNIGTGSTTNLTATLLAATGVTAPSPAGPQSYGVLAPGAIVPRTFAFTASGAPGSALTATFQLFDGGASLGTAVFQFTLGGSGIFTNLVSIVINDANPATSYPSAINVSGLTGVLSKVVVTLSKFSHSFPDDVDVLLVGPHGEKIMLLSDAGGDVPVTNKNLVFDMVAAVLVPDNGPLVAGTFLPTDFEPGDNFPAPAPAGPAGNSLDVLKASNPNGTWSLYVIDDTPLDAGSIGGGWSLAINTVIPVNSNANLSVSIAAAPSPGFVGSSLVYSIAVTNLGPNTATNVVLTDVLPGGLAFVVASSSQGTAVNSSGTVTGSLGSLASGAGATMTIITTPNSAGTYVNTVTASSGQLDLNLLNNTATVSTLVNNAFADLVVSGVDTPDPVLTGGLLNYAVTVTNLGPNPAASVFLTNVFPAGVSFQSATPSQGSASNVSGRVICNFGSIPAGAAATVTVLVMPTAAGLLTNALAVTSSTSDPNSANNRSNLVTTVNLPAPTIVTAGSAFVVESFNPANNTLELGETVTVNFALRNTGTAPTTNLVVTLLSGGGVASPGGPQSYGVLVPGGPSAFKSFAFTATGTNGGTVTAALQLQDGPNNLGVVNFVYTLPKVTTFANNNLIIIPDSGSATPYPASITVAGLTGVVSRVTVTLSALAHTFPEDIQALLVGPAGQKVRILGNAGGGNFLTNVNLTFDDSAPAKLPLDGQIVSGTNQPSVYPPTNSLPAPAPVGPYSTALAAFAGTSPNGTWSLYVSDDSGGDQGRINSGWSLDIATASVVPPVCDLSLATTAPASALVGSNVTIVVTVTNHGPSTATAVTLTDTLPAGLNFVSGFSSTGTFSRVASVVTAGLGVLPPGGRATLTIVAAPASVGSFSNNAVATLVESDPNPASNSSAKIISAVTAAPLKFARANNVFVASWSAAAGSYLLESTPSLSPPILWSPVAAPVSLVGGFNTVSNTLTSTNRFFRLRAP